jgi:hypothetical protein
MVIPGGDGKLIERGISAFAGCYLFLGLEMPSLSVLDNLIVLHCDVSKFSSKICLSTDN